MSAQVSVKVPKVGLTVESGRVAQWNVQVGDVVAKGDVIGQLEADKAVYDLEAPESGRVAALLVPADPDTEHPVGTDLAIIEVA